MNIAVLSDIHGNLEALDAVARDLDRCEVDEVICLGDLVGYGPDPEAVVRRVMELGYTAVLGNHEAALASERARNWMNFQAKENSISTEALLSKECCAYCCELPAFVRRNDAIFVHGAPPDSVTTYLYMLKPQQIEKIFNNNPEKLFFVGHTHQLKLVSMSGDDVVREKLLPGITMLDRNVKYLVNCGSVGQPRDLDNRAKYLIWDSEVWSLDVRAVQYDIESTAKKIVLRGFPQAYADRLR